MTTLRKTQQFLARRFAIAEGEITPERTLESLGIDSLAALELLFEIEEEFGVRFPDEAQKITTLGELVAALERELGKQQAAVS